MELICRILPGALLSLGVVYICYKLFPERSLRRDPADLASFFYPWELTSEAYLRVHQTIFSLGCGALPFVMLLTVTANPEVLKGVDSSLLSGIKDLTPAWLHPIIEELTTLVQSDQLAGIAAGSMILVALILLGGLLFSPTVIPLFRKVRGLVQQVLDSGSMLQAERVVRRFAAGRPDDALDQVRQFPPTVTLPHELDPAPAETKLTFVLITRAAPRVPALGIASAIIAVIDEHRGPPDAAALPRPALLPALSARRLFAAAFVYILGCVLYLALVPSFSTRPDGGSPQLRLHDHVVGDWICYQWPSLHDAAVEMAQFSLIVVVPFLAGLYGYASRRRRVPEEGSKTSLVEVLSGLFWFPLICAIVFTLIEPLRLIYQQGVVDGGSIAASMFLNGLKNFLLCGVPLILVWVWAAVLERRTPLLQASMIASVVAAICYCAIQAVFEAVLYQTKDIVISYDAYSALLAFWLVSLVGAVTLPFLTDPRQITPVPREA